MRFVSDEEISGFEEMDNRNIQFENCVFSGVRVPEVAFHFCVFVDCEFDQCDFSNMKVPNTRFSDCVFQECKLVGINWADTESLVNVKYQDCLLNYSIYSSMRLKRTLWQGCKMLEIDFSESDLTECSFNGCDLSASQFSGSNLFKADLRQALNYSINPKFCHISKAQFSLPEAMTLLSGFDIVLE